MLVALLAAWCATRVVLWETPFAGHLVEAAEAAVRAIVPGLGPASAPTLEPVAPPSSAGLPPLGHENVLPKPLPPVPAATAMSPDWTLGAGPTFAPVSPRSAGGQVLLLAAAFSQLQVPPGLAALTLQGRATPAPIPAIPQLTGDTGRASPGRWSGDAWVLLRQDTVTAVTSGRGSYGRSQAGAVLRYRLFPASPHRPAAYLRASTPLHGVSEGEVALGVTGRPLPSVPLALAAEVRGSRFGGSTEARPAAFAYSEFPPLKLPLGVRGEAYFQGGYVGGRFATAFVDGQVRVEREVARLGPAELRAGGGAWGGAQKGAERLDVGPGASVALDLGGAPLRMSADWRFRVAGQANPSSGPALTVSAGF